MADPSDQWWAEVAHSFRSHVRQETSLLQGYENVAQETSDPTVRYLLEMILADEHRHHEQFEEMAAAAQSALPETVSPTATAPAPTPEEAARLLELTETFLDLESEDAEELKELRRKLRPSRHDRLWHLLVTLMELDTTKHIATLEYLRDELRRRL
ncbi:MAG: hypothetical protein PV358_13100 [Acidimicrobiales bacterium]|nr:hypothetical protein [Acidimicrobiales bacterium]